MKALFRTMMYAGISGVVLMGCTSDDLYNPEAAKNRYQANWEKALGEIDPAQTWNTATSGTANVTVGYAGNYTVKLYTGNPRYADETAYLLGQFEVKGGQTSSLKFDMPSRLEYVYVGLIDEEGNRMIKSAKLDNGAVTVAFGNASTRTIYTPGDDVVKVSEGNYWEYGADEIDIPLNVLPENVTNLGKLTQNFVYESTGPFIVRPMYFVTSNNISLGIYYQTATNETKEVIIWNRANSIEKGQTVKWNDYVWNNETQQNDMIEKSEFRWTPTQENVNTIIPGNNTEVEKLRCQEIIVDIPVGTRFGFFITTDTGNVYSEKTMNEYNACYGATFHENGQLYLAFEDWKFGSTWESGTLVSDADFNDLVCQVSGVTPSDDTPVIVDKDDENTPITYIIACEDMGGEDDFDFNDIVLGIQHVSGQTQAYATLLAAGGSLPATVTYYNQVLFNEVHEAFGVSTTTLVNTGQGVDIPPVTSDLFTVSEDFSMSTHAQYFNIVVTNREGNLSTSISVPDQAGATPQAFLIADPDWKWPEERVNILDAYPDFAEWIANHSADSWYNAVWGTVIPKTEGEGGGGTTTPADGTTALSVECTSVVHWGTGNEYRISGDSSLYTEGKVLTFTYSGTNSIDICYSTNLYNTIATYHNSENSITLTSEVAEKIQANNGVFYIICWNNGELTSVTIK